MNYRAAIRRSLCAILAFVLCFGCTAAAFADAAWYCPKCGRKCDSTYNFCPVDGTAKPSDLGNSTAQETSDTPLQMETFADVESWTGIQSLSWPGDDYIIGLTDVGSVRIATYEGNKDFEAQLTELSGWNHIKQLISSLNLLAALKEDGTVIISSEFIPEYFQGNTTVYTDNLSEIKSLIPVQDYHFGYTYLLGVRENREVCWIVSQQNDSLGKGGVTPEQKLLNLLGDCEPVTIYYTKSNEEWNFTALTTDGKILSTEYPELNGLKNVKAIYGVMLFNGDPAIIASMSDGSTRIAGFVANYPENDAAYDLMKEEISSWRNVQDISVRYDEGKILGILADGSVLQSSYGTAYTLANSSNLYDDSLGVKLDFSDITDAAFFTSRNNALIVLKDGSLAPLKYVDSETSTLVYYSLPKDFKVSSLCGYYAVSEDGHVCTYRDP